MEERLSASGGELLARVANGVATVTLNRPAALNALSFGMLRGLREWLDPWERDDRVRKVVLRGAGGKAFCAGGDIRAIHDSVRGGSWFLSRVPGELGTYLGLVGPTIGAADAVYCGPGRRERRRGQGARARRAAGADRPAFRARLDRGDRAIARERDGRARGMGQAHAGSARGAAAMIVEKDGNPRWAPQAPLAPFFAPRWTAEEHPLASLSPTLDSHALRLAGARERGRKSAA